MAKPGADLAPTPQTGTNRQTRRGAVSPHSPDPVEPRPVEIVPLDALQPDERNANKGTERGAYMIRQSLQKLGAGRSILLDKNGKVIAGNKTLESAADIGLDDVLIVRTRGDQLVAVMREDLDLDDPKGQARELAYADNRTGQVSLDWDAGIVLADLDAGVDLSDWFKPFEIEGLTSGDTPDLDDLENEYGEPRERGFWPFIRVQVEPETFDLWRSLMAMLPGEDEAAKVARILEAVDVAILGSV